MGKRTESCGALVRRARRSHPLAGVRRRAQGRDYTVRDGDVLRFRAA